MKTLKDLRNWANNIPEEEWTINELEDEDGRRCVAGHLNFHLHGYAEWKEMGQDYEQMVLRVGIDPYTLVHINNGYNGQESVGVGETPKERVINYLDSFIKEKENG